MIIDNTDRYLDLDNNTVKITRRIHISGENEYLINDTKSRLKEIGTLFLDTGIGKTAYSVIGQGKVERIINSSPKEIKSIIEEAAGIKKLANDTKLVTIFLKVDKEELKNRLINRGDNLTEAEIQLRLNRLEYEESKTKLYDYVIKNDDLEKTVQIIMTIIENEKKLEDKNN